MLNSHSHLISPNTFPFQNNNMAEKMSGYDLCRYVALVEGRNVTIGDIWDSGIDLKVMRQTSIFNRGS